MGQTNRPTLDELTDEYIETIVKEKLIPLDELVLSVPNIIDEVGAENTKELLEKFVVIGKDVLRFFVRELFKMGVEWDFDYLQDEIDRERDGAEQVKDPDPMTPLIQELIDKSRTGTKS